MELLIDDIERLSECKIRTSPKSKLMFTFDFYDLEEKRHLCYSFLKCTGNMNNEYKWTDEILKPGYFHAAMLIYLTLTHPDYGCDSNLINLIKERGKDEQLLKIAKDVISYDSDGEYFLEVSKKLKIHKNHDDNGNFYNMFEVS